MTQDSLSLLNTIAQTIFDKKGINILAIDVREFSTLTDFFIIAEGLANKHVQAIARSIVDVMETQQERPIHVEGISEGDWVVIDYLNIVIHLFMPGLRDRYRLEELWHDGSIVNLKINTHAHNEEIITV